MFEQPFCGECGQMKDQCICIETGRIEDMLFPMSDVLQVEAVTMWVEATTSAQIEAAILDGLPMFENNPLEMVINPNMAYSEYAIEHQYDEETQAERDAEQKTEQEAESRMGGDNHYYSETAEEAEARFVKSPATSRR